MNGYNSKVIHIFEPEEEPDDELEPRVKYSIILQEEEDFMDED